MKKILPKTVNKLFQKSFLLELLYLCLFIFWEVEIRLDPFMFSSKNEQWWQKDIFFFWKVQKSFLSEAATGGVL